MWHDFINKKNEFIGCKLVDRGDWMDRKFAECSGDYSPENMVTELTDIMLEPNGESMCILFVGKDFSCGGDIKHVGLIGREDGAMFTFSGLFGHTFSLFPKVV